LKALRVGQGLDLEIENSQPRVRLKAVVQRSELGEVELTMNELAQAPPELIVGAVVHARFCTPAGYHEASSTVVKLLPGHPPSLVLDTFRGERTRQRRAYFRTSAYLDCEISVLVSKEIKAGESDRRAITLDISGGGIKLQTSLAVVAEDRVGIVVRVPPKLQPVLPPALVVEAKVLRTIEIVRQGRDLFQVAAAFQIKREVDRDNWVHLTMDLERGLDKDRTPDDDDE
jgi:hypothetical protein